MMFDYANVSTSGDERPYYFTLDRQYNVRGVVDRAGALVEIYKYDEYGRLRIRECPARGDMDNDGAIYNTKAAVDRVRFDAVSTGTKWDPRADLTDDGAVDVGDSTQRPTNVSNWYPASTPVVSHAFSGVGNRFGWQGRPHYAIDTTSNKTDGVLMLIDHRLRVYDPVLGRWLTLDPIGYNGGTFNLYEYIRSNSLSSVDPFGLAPANNYTILPHRDGSYHVIITFGDNKFTRIDYDASGNKISGPGATAQDSADFDEQFDYLAGQNYVWENLDKFNSDVLDLRNEMADTAYNELEKLLHPIDMVVDTLHTMKFLGGVVLDSSQPWHQRVAAAEMLIVTAAGMIETGLAAKELAEAAAAAALKSLECRGASAETQAIIDAAIARAEKRLGKCFVAGTLVVMADGTSRKIEEIECGEYVLCDVDPSTPEASAAGLVTDTIVRETNEVLRLELELDGELYTLRVTPEHPFYVEDLGEFIPVGDLEPGMCGRLDSLKGSVQVISVEREFGEVAVFNIRVEGAHNYFVRPCLECPGVLFHNADYCFDGPTVNGNPLKPLETRPYVKGGGHHTPAKSAFKYDPIYQQKFPGGKGAPAIPTDVLLDNGIVHLKELTPIQHRLYDEFAATGAALTWDDLARIETQALVEASGGKLSWTMAQATVNGMINQLKAAGVGPPTHIPWN